MLCGIDVKKAKISKWVSIPKSAMVNLLEAKCPNCSPKPTYHKVPALCLTLNTKVLAYKKQLLPDALLQGKEISMAHLPQALQPGKQHKVLL